MHTHTHTQISHGSYQLQLSLYSLPICMLYILLHLYSSLFLIHFLLRKLSGSMSSLCTPGDAGLRPSCFSSSWRWLNEKAGFVPPYMTALQTPRRVCPRGLFEHHAPWRTGGLSAHPALPLFPLQPLCQHFTPAGKKKKASTS